MSERLTTVEATTHADVRYHKGDVHIRTILACGAGLIAMGVAIHFGIAILFEDLRAKMRQEHPSFPPLVRKERIRLPQDIERFPEQHEVGTKRDRVGQPRLETSETKNIEQLRREEELRLTTYGWIDAKSGVVHIPIAEAMRLMASKGDKPVNVEADRSRGGK